MEFSFRPNTPAYRDEVSYDEILESISTKLGHPEDKNTQYKMIKLMRKLRKATTKGLNWEEALQIMMIKTHMQAKALLFY